MRILRQPLQLLSEGARALQDGRLSHRIPLSGRDEFADVARSVNALAAELEQHRARESAQRQRLEDQVAARTQELAHDIAVHIAFTKPAHLSRDEVPADEVAAERETLTTITRNEGKPEAALEKIVEGKLNGWFQERVLLEQKYVKDEKQTIAQLLGGAAVVRFGLIVVGG